MSSSEGPTDGSFEPVDAAAQALARARRASRSEAPGASGRGDAVRSTGTAAQVPGPTLVSDAISHLMRDRGWEKQTAVGGLTGRWREIVGDEVAEHVVPESFEQSTQGPGMVLILRADSTAWATSLRMLLPSIRSRIDAEIGAGTVREISILGPAAPSWRHGRFTVPGRGPRDTYG